jgi:predicted oxidoreductase
LRCCRWRHRRNHELVSAELAERAWRAAEIHDSGVPEHVDGRMIGTESRARLINRDRCGITSRASGTGPIWPRHGIRICPARPRCGSTPETPARAAVLGSDTLGQLQYIMSIITNIPGSLTQSIIKKEFALRLSKTLTHRQEPLPSRATNKGAGAGGSVQEKGADFIGRDNLASSSWR